jgi:uncharacterized protein (TIGR02284 family)
MSAPSKTLQHVEFKLQTILKVLIDSQEGFQKIGDEVQDETLRLNFLAESLNRAHFRGEIETVLHQEGVHDIKENGTANGAALRIWGEIRSKLGGSDHTLLGTADETEHTVMSAYDEALSSELPLPVRQMLAGQAAHVGDFHDYIKAARNKTP